MSPGLSHHLSRRQNDDHFLLKHASIMCDTLQYYNHGVGNPVHINHIVLKNRPRCHEIYLLVSRRYRDCAMSRDWTTASFHVYQHGNILMRLAEVA